MTDITELTPESARESGNILIIVAARMARREFFTPLHALCESGKRVVSTRALCDAVERAEEHMVSQVSKIVDGHDRLTKKLKEAESRNAELVEALERAQAKAVEQGRTACELFDEVTTLRQRIAELESRTVTVKSITTEVCYALKAEGLADVLKDAAEYAPLTAGQWETLTKNWHQTFIGLSGSAAGIKWEGE